MRNISILLSAGVLSLAVFSCGPKTSWTSDELAIINGTDSVMAVVTATASELESPVDTAGILLTSAGNDESGILRKGCADFNAADLASAEYQRLAEHMVATVTSPEQDGVGIAGPQVGLSRRVIAVQRFDKDGEPFEVYPNIRVTEVRGEKFEGPEGCLSIPGFRGMVMRYRDIDITYTLSDGNSLRDTTERIEGFTAVIFQHECDHLDGVLYTDKADTISVRE